MQMRALRGLTCRIQIQIQNLMFEYCYWAATIHFDLNKHDKYVIIQI